MKVKQWFSFCALLCSILLLSACGSNSGSGGDQSAGPAEGDLGTDTAGIKYVGSAKCIGCHDDFSWSTEIVDAYLMGKHVIHSDHITAADKVNGCLVCHDPIGDGPLLEAFIDAANVPTEGLAAIGCEACHGAGGDHYGIGPMPIAKPGIDACAQCHDKLPEGHLVHHPEADMISSNFVESRHFTASVRNGAVCSKCHTDVGGRLYKGVSTKTQLMASVMAVDSTAPVQCKTCHDPHHAGGLLMEAGESRGNVISSAEYETCITCHMSDRDDPADAEWMYHENVYYRIITDTHYDDPATPDVIEGYAISKLNDRACRDCHDVHTVKEIQKNTNTINDQWAKSRHAGEIGIVKKEKAEEYAAANMDSTTEQTVAIKEAGVLGDESSWPHYDWDAGDRQDCQRCHTATGFANYADNPATYDKTNNDFSHLAGWSKDAAGAVTSSGQNEMLYCWGCHSNNSGAMRDPGALTIDDYAFGASATFPDSAASNVCIGCHTGRATGDSIKLNTDEDGVLSFINSHYLTAGGILFATGGYQYDDRDYIIVEPTEGTRGDQHQDIGYGSGHLTGNAAFDVPAVSDSYTSGPCVTCHFNSDDGSHTLSPFTTDAVEGEVLNDVCVTCHTARGVGDAANTWYGKDFTEADFVKGEVAPHKGRMLAAQMALDLVLQDNGIYFAPSYPYFFNTSTPGPPATWFTNWAGVYGVDEWKNVMGAAFNLNLVAHDPGATAHNRRYARRLLYDAIDFMDDGTMNDSTFDTVTAQDQDFTESALNYIGSRP